MLILRWLRKWVELSGLRCSDYRPLANSPWRRLNLFSCWPLWSSSLLDFGLWPHRERTIQAILTTLGLNPFNHLARRWLSCRFVSLLGLGPAFSRPDGSSCAA